MRPSSPPVYRPSLQANLANKLYSDLVGGTFAMTALTADIDASVTTLPVQSAQGFNGATFRILVGGELMLVTGSSGTTTWTVQRGLNGTTPAPHSSSATVLIADRPREDSTYNRNDFTNTDTGANAFLARMRRTKNLQGGGAAGTPAPGEGAGPRAALAARLPRRALEGRGPGAARQAP
jgi:hypothetical protein